MNKKFALKTAIKLKKKVGIRYKKVILTPKQARIKQDLGDGFTRYVFFNSISPNQFKEFNFLTPPGNEIVISGGWWIQANKELPAYATSSYSQSPSLWIIVLHNPARTTRQTSFVFITKK